MDAHTNGYGHPKCYARALGGCCNKITGEHSVSRGVLELIKEGDGEVSRSVSVTGLAFQERDAIQEIGVSRLESKVLCDTHNNLLSPADGAAKAMFLGMDGLNRAAGDIGSPERTVSVDGDLLELWMLKVMCGGLYSGAWLVGPAETMKGVCPPLEWLQILFNGSQFPVGWGMYYLPAKADELITAHRKHRSVWASFCRRFAASTNAVSASCDRWPRSASSAQALPRRPRAAPGRASSFPGRQSYRTNR